MYLNRIEIVELEIIFKECKIIFKDNHINQLLINDILTKIIQLEHNNEHKLNIHKDKLIKYRNLLLSLLNIELSKGLFEISESINKFIEKMNNEI